MERGGYTRDKGDPEKARLTLEGEAALWGTPLASIRSQEPRAVHHGIQLANQVEQWMTPNVPNGGRSASHAEMIGRTAMHNGRKVQIGLEHQAKDWSTPRASDGEKGGPNMAFGAGGIPLPSQAAHFHHSPPARTTPDGQPFSPPGPTSRRRLNPAFVEWLMGWPSELSGFDTAAMASCHSPQPSHGCGCMRCWLTTQRAMLDALLAIEPPAQATLL